jgi:probable HAF family extracellular repeat protein
MNKLPLETARGARLVVESALASESKRVVSRRGSWRRQALSFVVIAALILLALGRPAAAQGCVGTLGPCFQALGFLAPISPYSTSRAISPDGSVVLGVSMYTGGGFYEGFRWAAGTMSGLGFPGCSNSCESYATGINQQGIISGYDFTLTLPVSQPYSWTNGVWTALPLLPGGDGASTAAIAAQTNVIVGNGRPGVQAVAWQNGVATALPSLPISVPVAVAYGVSGNGQVVVGESSYDQYNLGNTKAVMWQGNIITPLNFLSGSDTFGTALAANADGSVILGRSGVLATNSIAAVRWVNGIPTGLGDALDPTAIDATGLVISGGATSLDAPAAYRWTPADGIQSLQSLLTAAGVDTTGWNFESTLVNGNGRVFAGYGTDTNGHTQAFVARVPLPTSLVTMHTHDFSGEGKSDLLWQGPTSVRSASTFPVAVWTMNGAQVVQSAAIGPLPSNWAITGQRDFNGDGYADILWRDSSGNLAIWFMNGTQVSSSVALGSVPNNWAVFGTGDLNGDGKGDLLWRDSVTGTVAVWFMDGGNVLATASFGSVPSSWTIVADDNRGDILWQDGSGNIAIWQIDGTQLVRSAGLGNVPPGWLIAGIGDFNGDGYIDILLRNVNPRSISPGAVSIWFSNVNVAQNNSPYIAYATSLGSVPTSFTIVQTGDYNGDRVSDILWQDHEGNLSIWFLTACGNVACVSTSAVVGKGGAGWTIQSLNVE